MSGWQHILAGSYTGRQNLLTSIDARLKIVFVAGGLFINLTAQSFLAPLAITIFCLAALFASRVRPGQVLLRMVLPLLFAASVLALQTFLNGTTPLFSFSLGGLTLTGFAEGLAIGLLIMWRVISGMLLILFLVMLTPTDKLLLAAAWFRLPKSFLELLVLIYRYIFVLVEEAVVIRDAQRARLGYRGWHRGIRSAGALGGSIILRAYDRASAAFDAMVARGFSGSIAVRRPAFLSHRDIPAALLLGLLLAAFYIAGRAL